MKLHVISPAPASEHGDGWTWHDLSRRATWADEDGFPVEGSFGASYHVKMDLRGATEAQIKESMAQRYTAQGNPKPASYIKRHTGMLLEIYQHLKKGDKIRIGGFGVLQVRKRPARMGRNPATGEAIKIKASKKVAFRAAKELKEAV